MALKEIQEHTAPKSFLPGRTLLVGLYLYALATLARMLAWYANEPEHALGHGSLWTTVGKFIKDKVLRLLVPLLVNVFSLTILQVYLERLTHGDFRGSFFEFLPHYFEGIYSFGGNFSPVGNHLWYLAVLFLFCLVLLPLFLLLKSKPGARALGWFTNAVSFPGGIYLLALLFLFLWNLIDRDGILGFDGFNWNLGVYLSLLIYGFLVISSERLQRSIQRLRWVSLALAMAVTVWYILSGEHTDLVLWTYVLTFLGFGMRYLNRSHPALPYANEAVLPFYILSQTVQLSVGYFILAWPVSDLLKWVLTTAVSLGAILAIYEGLVRWTNLLRVLFGMKPLQKSPQVAPAAAQPAAQPQ